MINETMPEGQKAQRLEKMMSQYGNSLLRICYLYLKDHNYHVPAIPREGEHLSQAEAEAIADAEFLRQTPGVFTQEQIDARFICPASFYYVKEGNRCDQLFWHIQIQVYFDDGRISDRLFDADGYTGEILFVDISAQPGNG